MLRGIRCACRNLEDYVDILSVTAMRGLKLPSGTRQIETEAGVPWQAGTYKEMYEVISFIKVYCIRNLTLNKKNEFIKTCNLYKYIIYNNT